MGTLKATFFLFFCVLCVMAMGTAFSHLWRTNKTLATAEKREITLDIFVQQKDKEGALAETEEPRQFQQRATKP